MKTLCALMITFITQLSFASDWRHIYQNVQGYDLRLSFTTDHAPATYGSNGGFHEGLFYVDLSSSRPTRAQGVEVFEILQDGRLLKVSEIPLREDSAFHYYGKKPVARTYADFIWFGRNYLMRIYVDGRMIETKFRI